MALPVLAVIPTTEWYKDPCFGYPYPLMRATAFPFECMELQYIVWRIDYNRDTQKTLEFLRQGGWCSPSTRVVRIDNETKMYFIQQVQDTKSELKRLAKLWGAVSIVESIGVKFEPEGATNSRNRIDIKNVKVPLLCARAMKSSLRYCLLYLKHDKVCSIRKSRRVDTDPLRVVVWRDIEPFTKQEEKNKQNPFLLKISRMLARIYDDNWISKHRPTLLWEARDQLRVLHKKWQGMQEFQDEILFQTHLSLIPEERKAGIMREIENADCKACLTKLETKLHSSESGYRAHLPELEAKLAEVDEAAPYRKKASEAVKKALDDLEEALPSLNSSDQAFAQACRFGINVKRKMRYKLEPDPAFDDWMRNTSELMYRIHQEYRNLASLYARRVSEVCRQLSIKRNSAPDKCCRT